MIEIYYHLRDEKHAPRVTVCLLKYGDELSRGISICSLKDNPVKAKGKAKAKGRAYEALITKRDNSILYRNEALSIINHLYIEEDIIKWNEEEDQGYKSIYKPQLTDFELFLFEKAYKRQEL
jgi:hypothetical protein